MDPKIPPASPETEIQPRRPRPRHIWTFERLEDRTLLSPGPLVATPAQLAGARPITTAASGLVAPGESDFFEVNASTDELLIAEAHTEGAQTRLSLLDAQGDLLTQSDGLSPANPEDLIAQHIGQGTYYLELTGLGGIGSFSLTTQKPASSEPGSFISLDNESPVAQVVTGDFADDGRIDIAAGYENVDPDTGGEVFGVAILLGNGDGTFQVPILYPETFGSIKSLAVGDFAGDGRIDIAAGYENVDPDTGAYSGGVAIFLGGGDGTFQAPVLYPMAAGGVTSLAVRDFADDGRIDIAAGYENVDPDTGLETGGVAILPGVGGGTFQAPVLYPTAAGGVTSLAVGDFADDGRIDLAAGFGNSGPDTGIVIGGVSILLGNGNGTFQAPVVYPAVVGGVTSLAVGDFADDGRIDLAVGYENFNQVSQGYYTGGVAVLLGNGDGTFQFPQEPFVYPTPGGGVTSLAVGDFAGDGRIDIAAGTPSGAEILLGNGDATFQAPILYSTAGSVTSLAVGDFAGDGRIDIAAGYVGYENYDLNIGAVGVLLGDGDGTFQAPILYPTTDGGVTSLAVGDFAGDGRIDIAAGYMNVDQNGSSSGGVEVLLGNGDGTFQDPIFYPTAGGAVTSIAVGDFNGDGRIDIAAGTASGVEILLGDGDGTFQAPVLYPTAGDSVTSLAVGDFADDGRIDIAVGFTYFNLDSETPTEIGGVEVLLGNGNGTFQAPELYSTGDGDVTSLAVGDFAGDGRIDLAAGYENNEIDASNSGGVAVLLGNGDGTFQAPVLYPTAVGYITSLAVGDFAGDGRIDIAAGYENNDSDTGLETGGVAVLLDEGDGTFQAPVFYATNEGAVSCLVTGDFAGDGRIDIAAGYVSYDPDTEIESFGLEVLPGMGDGTFQAPVIQSPESNVEALAAGDFSGDGRTDLAYFDSSSSGLPSVLINTDSDTLSSSTVTSTPIQENPLLADLTGDGTDDLTEIDQSGDILFRRGIPGQPGSYEPPIVVNPGAPSRDIAIVSNGGRNLIASVDAVDDEVVLYGYINEGSSQQAHHLVGPILLPGFYRIAQLSTGLLPSQVISADLTGSGLEDLVVRNAGDGTASIYLGNANGGFTKLADLPIGLGASDIAAADLSGSGRDDLVVTNQATGDVRVFPSLGNGTFGLPSIYQAGSGPYALTTNADGSNDLTSQEDTAGVAVGTFTPGSSTGLAVINPGTNTLAILDGLGGGALANARTTLTLAPGSIVRTADFRNVGITDLAVLTSTGLDIYLGTGLGGFAATPIHYDVGPDPTGLTVADVNGDGKLDILVGNQFGDVLVLLGNGDGTFRPFQSADRGIALAVTDLAGNGQNDFIYADQGLDRVTVQYGNASPTVVAGPQQGLLAPGAVSVAKFTINGVTLPYLIVANSGSNDVLVYPGLGDGQFGPALNGGQGFFTGTNPVSVTVAYLTSNGLPDLVVADKGSNDVAILLGQMQDGSLTFTPGPRLKAGLGPVSTVVETLPGNPYPDLLVSDSQSNQVLMLNGLGQGFFNDQNPTVIPVGTDPGPLIVGDFTGRTGELDLVTVDTASDELTFISNFLNGGIAENIPSGGSEPVAALEFSDNGAEGLLVANEGDGSLALFLGGLGGLEFSQRMEDPSVPNPTALAYDSFSGDVLQFYAGTAGVEAATLLQFNLGDTGTTPGGGIPSPPPTPIPGVQIARLLPLGESSLAIVATLLTTTVEESSVDSQGTAGALPNQPIQHNEFEALPEEVAQAEDQEADTPSKAPNQSTLSPLNRFLYRLDEAIEKARQDARESTFAPPHPVGDAERSIQALDVALARWPTALAVAGVPSAAILGPLVRVGGIAARAIDSAVRTIPNGPNSPPPLQPTTPLGTTSDAPEDRDPAPGIAAAATLGLAGVARTLGDNARRRHRLPRMAGK